MEMDSTITRGWSYIIWSTRPAVPFLTCQKLEAITPLLMESSVEDMWRLNREAVLNLLVDPGLVHNISQ